MAIKSPIAGTGSGNVIAGTGNIVGPMYSLVDDDYSEAYNIDFKSMPLVAVGIRGNFDGSTAVLQYSDELTPSENDDDWETAQDMLGGDISITNAGSAALKATLGTHARWVRWKVSGGDTNTALTAVILPRS